MDFINSGANISPCGKYRYLLWRQWDTALPIQLWCMLNPSTAGETEDDPTIRKCIGFSEHSGFGAIMVINLYAFRATQPAQLKKAANPNGPANRFVWAEAMRRYTNGYGCMAAWGSHGAGAPEETDFATMARELGVTLWTLRETSSGAPGHPLYIPYTAQPTVWRA